MTRKLWTKFNNALRCSLAQCSRREVFRLDKPFASILVFENHCAARYIPIASFHSTSVLHAKGKKDKKGSDTDGSVGTAQLPDIKSYDSQMEKRISRLDEEFDKLKGGRISVDMLNHITVDIPTGGKLQITEIGQISMKNQSQLAVSIFDASNAPHVVKAIRDSSGMNLNPTTEGNLILVTVPKPSKESRESLIKEVAKIAEKTKTEVRNIRKDCMDMLKKLKGSVSEDDTRKLSKDIDSLVEKKLDKIVKMLKDKEKKLLD